MNDRTFFAIIFLALLPTGYIIAIVMWALVISWIDDQNYNKKII